MYTHEYIPIILHTHTHTYLYNYTSQLIMKIDPTVYRKCKNKVILK